MRVHSSFKKPKTPPCPDFSPLGGKRVLPGEPAMVDIGDFPLLVCLDCIRSQHLLKDASANQIFFPLMVRPNSGPADLCSHTFQRKPKPRILLFPGRIVPEYPLPAALNDRRGRSSL